jgi:hypothetical protein
MRFNIMKKLCYSVGLLLALCSMQVCAQGVDSTRLLNDLAVLSADSLQGRYVETEGSRMAREYIINRLQQIGVSAYVPNYVHHFDFYSARHKKNFNGQNILGMIEGYSDDIIVLSAHYDHLGMRDSLTIYNGADDNASGVAALLQIASYYAKNEPNNTILFAFFDAEEHGKQGAYAFVNSVIADTFGIKLNINLDMIGRNDKNELYASGTFHYPFLKPFIQKAAQSAKVKVLYGHDNPKNKAQMDWTQSSDHAAFHQIGIPYVYFGVEDHADYHKPSDEFKNIQPTFYVNATSFILEVVKQMDENLDVIKQKTTRKK